MKLNGETARTKPSSARYSTRLHEQTSQNEALTQAITQCTNFHAPGAFLMGCCEYSSSTYLTPKRKKSESYQDAARVSVRSWASGLCSRSKPTSAAASISACHAFFPWPSIVAAMSL